MSIRFLLSISLAYFFWIQNAWALTIENTVAGNINGGTACGTNNLTRIINVTDSFNITDLDVGFLATHAWRGDIRLDLTSPEGTTVRLITTNTGFGGNIDNYNILMDDSSATLINTAPHNTPDGTVAPPYENIVRPNNALTSFNGEDAQGDWTLDICDAFPAADNGTFLRASLIFDVPIPLTAVKSITTSTPGLYMIPGNEILYTITIINDVAATAPATDIAVNDILPDNLTFVSAMTTGFTGGAFGSPALPGSNTDCTGGTCIINFTGGSLPENSTGEIIVRAIIQ